MNDEQEKLAKKIGNFSLAVTVALLATAGSSHASTVRQTNNAQALRTNVGVSSVTPAGPSQIPSLADLSPNNRFTVGYGNYYTNWSDYSNHSNYNNYYSNWADYANLYVNQSQ